MDSLGAHTILARRVAAAIVALAVAICASAGVACAAESVLTIFHADSLTGYMAAARRDFQISHPGIEVRRQASGSVDAVRRVTDLHLACDLVVTADWRLLTHPSSGLEPWVAIFAGNSIGLLYTDHSAEAANIAADNWYRILIRRGVRFGHSNPDRDPAGYWTLILWRLAERYYRQPGLAERLGANCPASNIRPKSIDFIPLLESGDLDYFFGYSSDARLGGLRFLKLPRQIDLEDPARASDYASASIEVGSGANRRRIEGAPIAYGATLASDAPNRAGAIEFLALMLGERGRNLATRNGLIAYPAALAFDPQHTMPRELQSLCRPFNPR